jgi:hypothetical protein
MELTKEQKEQLGVLVRYPEFKVLETMLQEKADEITDIRRNMPGLNDLSHEAQFVGRNWAWSFIASLLEELKILTRDTATKENVNFN